MKISADKSGRGFSRRSDCANPRMTPASSGILLGHSPEIRRNSFVRRARHACSRERIRVPMRHGHESLAASKRVDLVADGKAAVDFAGGRTGIIDRTLLNARCAARLGLIRSYL